MKAEIVSIFIMCALTSYGHIAVKQSSPIIRMQKNPFKFAGQFFRPLILSGLLSVLSAPLFYFYALKSLDLNTAYSYTALNQILIPSAGIVIFREKLTVKKISALILIITGIFIWNI